MAKKPTLTLVAPPLTAPAPPRELGTPGLALWNRITSGYNIDDPGSVELLVQACTMADRAEALAASIERDGAVIYSKAGPKPHPAIREELGCRSFVTRTLVRLGITLEAIKPPGRPGSPAYWTPLA